MESEIKVSTERPSLLILNEYCLLEICEFLQLDDSMNLAESCNRLRRIADLAFKIKSKFELNKNMFRKGDKYIDRVFTHIGHNVSCLRIGCCGINPNLSKIISDCKNLKSLQFRSCNEDECQIDSTLQNFDNIELLSLWNCDLGNLKMFLRNFYKLKFLTIRWCHSNEELMTALLNNNTEMESLSYFVTDSSFCIFQLLERIPKVKRLDLQIFRTVTFTELNSLLTLNGLTKLLLGCCSNNMNNVLSELGRKGIMEEMELRNIEIDHNFFDILKSFVKLQLLVISTVDDIWMSSFIWPTNLKRLLLAKIVFTHLGFISTIQQLKNLQFMDIQCCRIAESDVADFKNGTKLSRNILNVMDHGNRKQRLEVALPCYLFGRDDSQTHLLVDSKPLRIFCRAEYNAFRIEINFPGMDY